MFIDEKLKWKDQIDSVSKNVPSEIKAIKLIKPNLPTLVLDMLKKGIPTPISKIASVRQQLAKYTEANWLNILTQSIRFSPKTREDNKTCANFLAY